MHGFTSQVGGRQRGQSAAQAMAGQPERLTGLTIANQLIERTAGFGKGCEETLVNMPSCLISRWQKLAIDPEVVLLKEGDLGDVLQRVKLDSRTAKDDDDDLVILEDQAPVLRRSSQPLELIALFSQGRLLNRRGNSRRIFVDEQRSFGQPPGIGRRIALFPGLIDEVVRALEIAELAMGRTQAINSFGG